MEKYNKEIEGTIKLVITDTNLATITGVDIAEPVTVQLENDSEAEKMILEFEDESGDSMHNKGSIYGKYEQLHDFRP